MNINQNEEKNKSDINLNKKETKEETKDNKLNLNKKGNLDKELKFKLIKEELSIMVDGIIKKHLTNKKYDRENAQIWTNNITDEIIQKLNENKYGLKFVCCGTIIEKGDCSLHYTSTSLSNQNTDGSLLVKFENEYLHCFINLYFISAYS